MMQKPDTPYVIGLTGVMGAGKSTVSAFLAQLGAQIVDADAIARKVTEPGMPATREIREAFGDSVFDGEVLARKRLAARVFADEALRLRLEEITHARIAQAVQEALCNARGPVAVYDAPLLLEAGQEGLCDEIWVVRTEERIAVERASRRDASSAAQVLERMRTQMPQAEKCRRADVIIDNSGDLAYTLEQTREAYTRVLDRLHHEKK